MRNIIERDVCFWIVSSFHANNVFKSEGKTILVTDQKWEFCPFIHHTFFHVAKIVIEMVQNEFDTCTICAIQKSNFIHSETEIYHWKGERRKDSCISFILILRNRICECTYQWLYTLFVVRCLPDECAEEEKKKSFIFSTISPTKALISVSLSM